MPAALLSISPARCGTLFKSGGAKLIFSGWRFASPDAAPAASTY